MANRLIRNKSKQIAGLGCPWPRNILQDESWKNVCKRGRERGDMEGEKKGKRRKKWRTWEKRGVKGEMSKREEGKGIDKSDWERLLIEREGERRE